MTKTDQKGPLLDFVQKIYMVNGNRLLTRILRLQINQEHTQIILLGRCATLDVGLLHSALRFL